ncbi:hypothetical protein D4T97_011070 [Siminovitchia acidinfaciens]|uniref:Bacterial Ig domain-containing protein n=1 Tax=Siminovitchia acidinfaciens TaxID=2321395 RepID=A0A429XZK8_9BACI|nr:hypothetical protein D4T97_011070 [Siminovitchia acidinfaciens]
MKPIKRILICILVILLTVPAVAFAQDHELQNSKTSAVKRYMLITNESVNGNKRQSTGATSVHNGQYLQEDKPRAGANKLDVNRPIDIEKFEDKEIERRALIRSAKPQVGDTREFHAFNFKTFRNDVVNAKLLYSGAKAHVWVEGKQITEAQAEEIGLEFDDKIYPVVTENFASESDVNGDGKINILCYNIQDNFPDIQEYVAGYFYAGDLYNEKGSNRSEIFYIDTYPSMGPKDRKDVKAAYTTLAHEFQHLVNFNQNVLVEGGEPMDTWLDEGLAMAAEHLYMGQALQDRIYDYNNNPSIRNGHSLIYWDDFGDVIANYSLSYLFMQYIRAQEKTKGNAIYKEILEYPENNYKAVEKATKKKLGKLMTNFRAALLLKEKTGVYGFNGEPGFSTLKPRIYKGQSANLRGGGAIVKESTGKETIPTSKGGNITYTFFGPDEPKDHTAPAKPVVSKVSDWDTVIKGKVEAGATVYVKAGSVVLGKAVSDSKKSFSITIKKQRAGTKLQVYAVDPAGNKSDIVTLNVLDKTPPPIPTVSKVSNRDLKVSGNAEAGSKVVIKAGSKVIGSSTANKAGKYSVTLKVRRKAGSTLYVTAADKAGNVSKARKVTVVDKIPPKLPKVNKVTNRTTVVKGKAEVNSTVYVKVGKKVLGSAKANSKGNFSVKVKRQRAGTVLMVYAKDRAGNAGKAIKITVKKA